MSRTQPIELPRNNIHRVGRGRTGGRSGPWISLNLLFWAYVTRVAMTRGRVTIVTGARDCGFSAILDMLPGTYLTFDATRDEPGEGKLDLEEVPRAGHLKVIGPKDFERSAFQRFLEEMARSNRNFTIATSHDEWLRDEIKVYLRQPGSRPLFWLHLN